MGRKTVTLTATASLSNHNSEQDEADEQAWERFAALVRELAERAEFAAISVDVSGGSW